MAQWTKYNNPHTKRRKKRKVDYNDHVINASLEMLRDKRNGYEIGVEYYEKKHRINGGE